MWRNSPTSVIVTCLLPDFTTRYLSVRPTSVTSLAHKLQGSNQPLSLALPWLASTEGLSLPIWIQTDADKLHSRPINVSLCMEWFVRNRVNVTTTLGHHSFVFFFFSRSLLSDVCISLRCPTTSPSMFAHMRFAHMKLWKCKHHPTVCHCYWESGLLSFSTTKVFSKKALMWNIVNRFLTVTHCWV